MASEARHSSTAIETAISSAGHNYPSPNQRRWRGYWTRYWCFKSHKRENRIAPSARSEGASGPVQAWPPPQALAPPSSPASFINSSAQSPASFSLSLSAVSASMYSPGPPNTMFTIGPYAHETQLVSPPVFSAFTTEPNTAPFTPPPELTHLTTPSSPDVPFAQYIKSSLEAKAAARETISPLSTSTLASPCETPACYTPTSGHLYLGSPVSRLISPRYMYPGHDATSENKFFSHSSTPFGQSQTVSSFPTFDPFAAPSFDKIPFAAFILPCDTNSRNDESSSIIPDIVSEDHEGLPICKEASDMGLKLGPDLDLRNEKGGICESISLDQDETYNKDGSSCPNFLSSRGECCNYKSGEICPTYYPNESPGSKNDCMSGSDHSSSNGYDSQGILMHEPHKNTPSTNDELSKSYCVSGSGHSSSGGDSQEFSLHEDDNNAPLTNTEYSDNDYLSGSDHSSSHRDDSQDFLLHQSVNSGSLMNSEHGFHDTGCTGCFDGSRVDAEKSKVADIE